VLRAAVARAIVSAGLLPALGIHHDSRSNSFCLADDLVEPLRPIVDRRVRELFLSGVDTLSRQSKEALLSLLTVRVGVPSSTDPRRRQTGPLMVSLHRYVASFVECIPVMQPRQKLAIPTVSL
jgi:CRISPR-associated protein Cas1